MFGKFPAALVLFELISDSNVTDGSGENVAKTCRIRGGCEVVFL